MSFNIAINGFGRIGRNILRALFEANRDQEFSIKVINDLGDIQTNAHLFQHDSVHGKFPGSIATDTDHLIVNGHAIRMVQERDPNKLPWKEHNIDLVLECTGLFASPEKSTAHINAGAKKVLISAPGGKDCKTIVYGVNQQTLCATDTIVSNASCTTNCLAPVAKILNDNMGIEQGLMVTIHAYTNDQCLTDSYHTDLRRARSATQSMIPTKTGAATAVGLVMPELIGKLDGYAMRVPTINVSVVDLTVTLTKPTSADEINGYMEMAAKGDMKDILGYNLAPLVSIDFNHHPASSIFDATQTRVIGNMAKIVTWYDNEWGFSNRMLDTASALLTAN